MKSYCASWLAYAATAVLIWFGAARTAAADGLIANWTLGDLGSPGTAGTPGVTTFADATGNGHTGTLVGSDPLSSVSAVIGTGVQFGGNMAADYISVPKTSDLGGMNALTLSAWVNIPTEQNGYSMVFDMYGNGTDGNEVYELGTYYSSLPQKGLYAGANYYAANDYANGQGFWNRTDGSGYVANTWELLTMVYSGGNTSGSSYLQLYVNGMLVKAGLWRYTGAGPVVLPSAAAGQDLLIGGNGGQEWLGGLNDLGLWGTDLTGVVPITSTTWTEGSTGGEITALYNTPMFNNHSGALSQYGVSAMDKLFTLYDAQATAPAGVTTVNGTLGWKYVSGGLSASSGVAGQLSDGQYFVQLDQSGGGVESLLPGDANGDGKVDVNDLTVVLSHFGQSGQNWGTGDFTGDGKVDVNDLTIVLSEFGLSTGSSVGGLAAVPEPSALLMVEGPLAGLAVLAWRRRPR